VPDCPHCICGSQLHRCWGTLNTKIWNAHHIIGTYYATADIQRHCWDCNPTWASTDSKGQQQPSFLIAEATVQWE
jgi:hypothetical protein